MMAMRLTAGWTASLTSMLAVLLLAACASSYDELVTVDSQPTVLKIYVYTPDHPIPTRSDLTSPDVAASEAERKVNSLHIWVFTHDESDSEKDGRLVGYINTDEVSGLNTESPNAVYQMQVPDWFVAEKPRVDVYVMANVTAANCGLTLGGSATRDQLDAAQIAHGTPGDWFGLTGLGSTTGAVLQQVPVAGLPMSGVLKDMKVEGDAPVLRIVYNNSMAKVTLVRAVSKVRFVFSRSSSNTQPVAVTSISLDGNMLPTGEHLFLKLPYDPASNDIDHKCHVGKDGSNVTIYETSAATLVSSVGDDGINGCDDPSAYVFSSSETGQGYEDRINQGLTSTVPNVAPSLSELGRFYLRESDKILTGKINYTVDGSPREATFSMKSNGDFSRNHTWIVYAYFQGGDLLQVNTVDVKSWNIEADTHEVYNW